jgi:transcriptional regulator with XRE-family HTH domain
MPQTPSKPPRRPFIHQAGQLVRDGRVRLSMTAIELAERAHVSRQMVGDIERAETNPTLGTLERVFAALNMEVDLMSRAPQVMLGDSPKQRDSAHAIMSGYVQRRLEADGWEVHREVRIDSGRYHGWIDLVAFHADSATLLIVEIKTIIDDLGGIERSMDWYVREVPSRVLKAFGWRPKRFVPWLLVLATDQVETQLRTNRDAIDAAFPTRAVEMAASLTDSGRVSEVIGVAPRGVALIDPRSPRRVWLIRSRLDGRRSGSPYQNYADFMRKREAA